MKFINIFSILSLLFVSLFGLIAAQEHCACPDNYLPVCGADSNTYGNKCEFDCQARVDTNLKVAHEGPC